MEILNNTPFQLAPLAGRVGFPGHSLTIIVKATFDVKPGEPLTPSEEQRFPTGDEPYPDDEEGQGSVRYASDFAYLKPKTDLLLTGTCHPPGGKPSPVCPVRFLVGEFEKSLTVFGDRHWTDLLRIISDPVPFTKMPLRYEAGYGGPGYAKNPVGKGHKKQKDEDGRVVWPLPNIEDPDHLMGSPGSRPEPAGFGPLGITWPQRNAKLGTYDKKWLKQQWPWFPKDFDWTYFNAAPATQQLDRYLTGDEALRFENLHPAHPVIESRLPGLRIRCFVNTAETPGEPEAADFQECKMNLDTLWADMDAEKVVLVWRGVVPVESEIYEEVAHLYIDTEILTDKPASVEEWKSRFQQALAAMDAEEAAERPWDEENAQIDAAVAKIDAEVRQAMKEAGIDPDAPLPPPAEGGEALEAETLKALGLSASPLVQWTRESVVDAVNEKKALQGEDLRDLDLSGLSMAGADFRNALMIGANMKGANLEGADFTGANLSGANLGNARLSKACLEGADLTGANLTGATLTEAQVKDAFFEASDLSGADCQGIRAEDTIFSRSNLEGTRFMQSQCPGAEFSECRMNGADFREAVLSEANFEAVSANGSIMDGADITELRATGGDFSKGSFRKCQGHAAIWENADLTEANLEFTAMRDADFSGAVLRAARLTGSDMRSARFQRADLTGAVCVSVNLMESSFEKANLTEADFRSSNMYGSEFLEAVTENTLFEFANLRMSKLWEGVK